MLVSKRWYYFYWIKAKIDALDDLINSGGGAVSDPGGALILVNTIGSVLGTEDEGPKSIGLEVGNKAVDATGVT